jgi:hypothetical protein
MSFERLAKPGSKQLCSVVIQRLLTSTHNYQADKRRLDITFQDMMASYLKKKLREAINGKYTQLISLSSPKNSSSWNFEYDGSCVDWYDCNTIDREDASKYIGYHRREYEDSRFGSFPIHDGYDEESWADGNSWE